MQNANNYQQVLPPPPPPPPIKPKRTFEYGPSSDLHSESGTFLLANNDYDNTNELVADQNYLKKHRKQRQEEGGSATSLDEEDLDLNDLKDFEDMTFDNLKRPEQQQNQSKSKLSIKKSRQVLIGENNNTSEQSLLIKSSESSSANTINNIPCGDTKPLNELENTSSKNLNDLNSNNTQTTAVDASSNNTDLNIEEIQEKIYEETEI